MEVAEKDVGSALPDEGRCRRAPKVVRHPFGMCGAQDANESAVDVGACLQQMMGHPPFPDVVGRIMGRGARKPADEVHVSRRAKIPDQLGVGEPFPVAQPVPHIRVHQLGGPVVVGRPTERLDQRVAR